MQNTAYEKTFFIDAIEEEMSLAGASAQAGANLVTAPARLGISKQSLAAVIQLLQIADGLHDSPALECVLFDSAEIGFGGSGIPYLALAQDQFPSAFALSRAWMRSKTPSGAIPLASPASIAVRRAASLAS